jgi:hypothetical protein
MHLFIEFMYEVLIFMKLKKIFVKYNELLCLKWLKLWLLVELMKLF